MNRTITSCVTIFPIISAIMTKMLEGSWKHVEHRVRANESGSATVSTGFFMRLNGEGEGIDSGAELRLETIPDPKDPRYDELYATFYFSHKGIQVARVDVSYKLSDNTWSLLHSRNPASAAEDDPTRTLLAQLGITTPGGFRELADMPCALAVIDRLSVLAREHAVA